MSGGVERGRKGGERQGNTRSAERGKRRVPGRGDRGNDEKRGGEEVHRTLGCVTVPARNDEGEQGSRGGPSASKAPLRGNARKRQGRSGGASRNGQDSQLRGLGGGGGGGDR